MNDNDQKVSTGTDDNLQPVNGQLPGEEAVAESTDVGLVEEADDTDTVRNTTSEPTSSLDENTTPDLDMEVEATDLPAQPSGSGEDSMSGTAPSSTSDDDTAEEIEAVTGNAPVPGEPFSMAEEVEKDELERRGMDPADAGTEEAAEEA